MQATTSCTSLFMKQLRRDPDLQLTFDDRQLLPGHSQILGQWSNVLRDVVCMSPPPTHTSSTADTNMTSRSHSTTTTTNNNSSSSSSMLTIPLPGTKVSDWLKCMAFAYPSVEPATVNWDNLEALLLLGDKYDMPVLREKAGVFLTAHIKDITAAEQLWKWMKLADKAGLKAAVEMCVTAISLRHRSSCVKENLQGLSREGVEMLVCALAAWPSSRSSSMLLSHSQLRTGASPSSVYYYNPAAWRY